MSVSRQIRNQKARWPRRVLLGLLVAGILGVLPMTGLAADEEKVPLPAVTRKPVVTVQGNAVIDEAGKPTGFYELALCVQTEFITEKATGAQVSRAEYEEAVAKAADADAARAAYEIVNADHQFRSVAAALTIDTDILTPVSWDAAYPKYDAWDGTSYSAATDTPNDKGIRGISAADNAEWLEAVPNITGAELGKSVYSVGLDTAKPDEVSVASARVEGYNGETNKAVLTLAAGLQLGGRSYSETTPVVVVRFSYDLKRFPDVLKEKGNRMFDVAVTAADAAAGTTPITYLSTDSEAAQSTVNQSVWYEMYMKPKGEEFTSLYYYHGADTPLWKPDKDDVTIKGEANKVSLYIPDTRGKTVLADNTGDGTGHDYSYFHNLLQPAYGTLEFEYVNQTTYRKPTGVAGVMILYYDWDDSLIGAQMVAPKGDVRAQVNEYVERNFIHPELRTSGYISAAGGDRTLLLGNSDYENLTESLARDYTYRGEYAYEVGKDLDDSFKRGDDSEYPGSDYPLTNKLDYAFYRWPTTVTEMEETDGSGRLITRRYYTVDKVKDGPAVMPEDEEYTGYLYPYVNGWALVEDNSGINQDNWMVRRDAKLTESVWTTFGVGELKNMDPKGAQTFVDQGGNLKNYAYSTTNRDDAWYLRFADFSDIGALLKPGQDTVIVKAVYEPGKSLLPDDHYTVVDGSLRIERYGVAASTEESVYSFQYQYQRASSVAGPWRGVKRTRSPAVQSGFTYDVNAFDKDPTKDTKAFYMKTISNNSDILNIDITAGGILWKIGYILVDTYNYNIATGVKRSAGGEWNLKNNFLYAEGVEYENRQGTDGFVFEATLNTLLTEATKEARGEQGELLTHFSLTTIADMNIRANSAGGEFTFLNYDYCATYLQDLVTRLYRSNNPAYLDKYGNVKLGWHQIQRHILMCMQAGKVVNGIFDGTTLTSEADCAGFLWCRLDGCAKDVTVDILDWHDVLLAFQKVEEGNTKAEEALDKLLDTGNTILTSPAFRRTEDGALFGVNNDDRTAIRNRMAVAYDALKAAGITSEDDLRNVSWQEMQYLLINGTYKPGGANYWWENGGKMPIRNWNDLIRAGCLVVRSTDKVPDALDALASKDATFLDQYVTYAAPTGSPANVGWFRDHYSDEDDNAFPDIATFQTKWLKALTELGKHYNLPDDWNTISWYEIQYALINGAYADTATVLATTNYWWKDGGQPKLKYEKLLAAMNKYKVEDDATDLDTLLTKGINPVNNEVYLRRTATGGSFTSVSQFKAVTIDALTLLSYATNGADYIDENGNATLGIYQMQYLLLNYSKLVGKEMPTEAEVKATYGDAYWWIEDPHLPTEAQTINDIMDLIIYTYWSNDGVDGTMLPFDPLEKLNVATMTKLGLRSDIHGIAYSTEDVIALVKAAVKKLPYTVDNFSSQTAADLAKELQYVLLHNSYQPAASITENYWWQTGGLNIRTQADLLQAAWIANVGFGGKTATDALNKIPELNYITNRPNLISHGLALRSNMNGTPYATIGTFRTALATAMTTLEGAGLSYDDMASITQHQFQYLLINGVYKTDAEVKAEVIVDGVDAYWWFTMDSPPEPEEEKTEIKVDPDEWTTFITQAGVLFKKTTGDATAFDSYPLTAEVIKDKLLLRYDDGSEIAATDFFDADNPKSGLVWQVLDAIYNSTRKKEFFGTLGRVLKVNPTWYEFQYILSHLGDVKKNWTMPSADECEQGKEEYSWIWKKEGAKTYTLTPPAESDWTGFITQAGVLFKKTTGDATAFDSYPLTAEVIKDTLLLRYDDGSEIAATDFFDADNPKSGLVWQVLDAIYNSTRKKEFFGTLGRVLKVNPTWYEFQYILSHLGDVKKNWTMPSADECKTWAEDETVKDVTKKPTPWAWVEDTV